MKKSNYSLLLLVVTFVLSSCSSVKVLDSWKADNAPSLKEKNILVIARTDNKQARIAFEQAIANQLRDSDFKATESFKELPNIDPDKKLDEAQTKTLVETIKREGYHGVVLSVVKDYSEATRTSTDGGYYAGASYGAFYPGYYGGFYGYYSHPMTYVSTGSYMPMTTTTTTVKTFVIETVAYNLDEEDGKQLVSVVTSSLENPSNLTDNAEEYAKKIKKALKN
ncbi:hypothetical protein FNB79_12935 [Formosa sediminum]|uniref:DUF4136 domain-containing protein n=1 Tax=Formosa sediminum TaxID=2594004 RepID=A0A516GTJ2_9FLAO|nr:hypothetical protein [Formosa sediminum]QDO94831.1 hypothetical protein FNB79_12935 [Formosa sediminum]